MTELQLPLVSIKYLLNVIRGEEPFHPLLTLKHIMILVQWAIEQFDEDNVYPAEASAFSYGTLEAQLQTIQNDYTMAARRNQTHVAGYSENFWTQLVCKMFTMYCEAEIKQED